MFTLCKASHPLHTLIRSFRPKQLTLSVARHRRASTLSLNPLKWFNRKRTAPESLSLTETTVAPVPQPDTHSHEEEALQYVDEHPNKFIPVTRGTLLQALVMEKGMFTAKEKRLMDEFAAALDKHYSHKFYGILEQSKVTCSYRRT